MKPKYAVLNIGETFLQSLGSDIVTFGFLLLCIHVSRDSAFWTFILGCMFLVFVAAKFTLMGARSESCYFTTKAELVAWANDLPDDTKVGAGVTAEVAE